MSLKPRVGINSKACMDFSLFCLIILRFLIIHFLFIFKDTSKIALRMTRMVVRMKLKE